jgi:hypothetical protein
LLEFFSCKKHFLFGPEMLLKLIQTSRIGFSQSARFSAVAAANKSSSTLSGQQLNILSVCFN